MKKLIGVVPLACIVMIASLFNGCGTKKGPDKHEISPPDSYGAVEGAAAYGGEGDHPDSPYFKHPDFYGMKSNDTLTILPGFKTYQQTTDYHCGPAAALMVLHYYGKTDADELSIGEMMRTHEDVNGSNEEEPGVADERGEWGTSTERMLDYFDQIGWETRSGLTEGTLEDGATFDDPPMFRDWVLQNLKDETPVMVEWLDWAGHWQVIIGYDTMGTEHFGDDVLIMADPYDTSDHYQDGYYIVNAERFFYMWLDAGILPEDQSMQQWIIAKP